MRARDLSFCMVAGALSVGCGDPPCETYWRPVCATCNTAGSTSCDGAKAYAKNALEDDDACDMASHRLKSLNTPKLVCALGESAPPNIDDLTRQPWTCNKRPLVFGLHAIRVGGRSYELVQFHADTLNLRVTSNQQTTCRYSVEGDNAFFECASELHELGSKFTCVRGPGS